MGTRREDWTPEARSRQLVEIAQQYRIEHVFGDAILAHTRLAGSIQLLLIALCVHSFPTDGGARQEQLLPIMPLPARIENGLGEFPIDGNLGIILKGYREPRLERARQRFLD